MLEDSPYEDIMDRYSDPIELDDVDFANGGIVNYALGGLTKTVPPVKGPDSQGVESLFRRRYN